MSIRKLYFYLLPLFVVLTVHSAYAEDSIPPYALSKTLPVVYIDTENNTPITSKEYYLPGHYWLDPMGDSTVTAFGSAEAPLPLEIRGRGNSSWIGGPKKPYKLKLDKKAALLGMPKNKHWALLHPTEHTAAGLPMGPLMGMAWSPSYKPVEVVLNGDYIGLYFLTETIRIDKDRVNIYEQQDQETDSTLITGGWLVEIDNYDEECQIVIPETESWKLLVTYHSPENLSDAQKNWLTNEFTTINAAIYKSQKNSPEWADFIDMESMARYFILQEVMDNPDGFSGSFYLHKDLGDSTKWVVGPIWDLSCYCREKTDYTYLMEVDYGFIPHWIGELLRYPSFCDTIEKVWKEVYPDRLSEIYDIVTTSMKKIDAAWLQDAIRWGGNTEYIASDRGANVNYWLKRNMEWFDTHLPKAKYVPTAIETVETSDTPIDVFNLQGIRLGTFGSENQARTSLPKGLYIARGKKLLIK